MRAVIDGRRLRELRDAAGLSRARLAAMIGASISAVARIERQEAATVLPVTSEQLHEVLGACLRRPVDLSCGADKRGAR